jgi:deoxyuridine 5'-triphosphate nucleotidohydrolase
MATLFLFVDKSVPGLLELYTEHVRQHNEHVRIADFPNSGFDIFVPEATTVISDIVAKIDFKIKMEMIEENRGTSFYMYPRSSISKTSLILANQTGIIDSGYRGNLIGVFRNLSQIPFQVEKHTRLVQLCLPSLRPFYVTIIESEDKLSITARGNGGFGSTGVVGQML